MGKVINGQKLALKIEKKLFKKIKVLKDQGIRPVLVVLYFENDQAGRLYSKLKLEAGNRVGIRVLRRPVKSKRQLKNLVVKYAKSDKIDGLVIQYPGLKWAGKLKMDRKEFMTWWQLLVNRIPRKKDVDGLRNDSAFDLGAVRAVEYIILRFNLKGLVAVIGARGFVGKKMVKKLKKMNYQVWSLDKKDNLKIKCPKADILISTTGRKGLISESMVKKGAGVIDLGWPEAEVDFKRVKDKAGLITPVPGGVGPLTVVCLLENLVNKW